jgi:hypothetical protein
MSNCVPSQKSEYINFGINTLTQITFVLIFLTLFFIFVVSNVMKDALKDALKDNINQNFNEWNFLLFPYKLKDYLKQYVGTNIDQLSKELNKLPLLSEDVKSTVINNINNRSKGLAQNEIDKVFYEEIDKVIHFYYDMVNSKMYGRIIQYYDKEEANIVEHNNGLINNLITINVFFIIILILVTATAKASCQNVPILKILLENAGILFFVGIIESVFFYYIVQKYVPIPPSLIISTVFDELKKKF